MKLRNRFHTVKPLRAFEALVLIAVAITLAPEWASAEPGQVRIYRDGWGVPHIYGNREVDAMYAFGYAQAEDRLEAILKNYLAATGQMARHFGKAYVEQDFTQRLWRHKEIAIRGYPDLDPEVRNLVEGFLGGVNAYMEGNPEAVPAWGFEPEPYHVLALARYATWPALLAQAEREYAGESPWDVGSNQWVVSAERSAEDAVILCIDPHAPWGGQTRWYEAHLHGGNLDAFGFTHPGLPVFLFGHNDFLGWSAAPGGSDAADVYEIEMESPTASRYRYEGTWKEVRTDTIRIEVRIKKEIETLSRRTQRSDYGPILFRQGRRATIFRFSAKDLAGQIEQYYRQMTAKDVKAFFSALALAQTGPLRLVYGDVEGNISTIRTGRIPVRSEMFQWDRPLQGNGSETDWLGVHPQEDLIQIHNPSQGWLQDCGTPPDLLTAYSPLTPDRYPDYIFNSMAGSESPRSFRARQLLSRHSRMTLQEAFDVALDAYVVHSELWQRALLEAFDSEGPALQAAYPHLEDAVRLIGRWDGRADQEAKGMALYVRWQQMCRENGRDVDIRQVLARERLGRQTRRALLRAVAEAAFDLKSKYARFNLPWKAFNRVRRGERSWGLSGSSGNGLESLKVVAKSDDPLEGYAESGQSCTTVVLFRAPGHVESYSVVPFGQSDDLSSPHAWDQAEALFSLERLKPTGYRRAGAGISRGLRLGAALTVDR